jgi:diguanylate cyclase (GGDEF)-like protein
MRSSPERTLTRYTVPAAALLAAALALLPGDAALWDALNRALPSPPEPRVVVVGIDDATLRDYGRLDAWPADLYAQALRTLDEAGVQTIGLDVKLSQQVREQPGLRELFARPNMVLATEPGAPAPETPLNRRSLSGISTLDADRKGTVRTFRTAYADRRGGLQPSFVRQLAVSAGQPVPLDTSPRLLRRFRSDPARLSVIPFRDVVNGNVRFGDLQGRVVLIGLTAEGQPGAAWQDTAGTAVPAALLQARAVSTLLGPPLVQVPLWLTLLLCMGVAALAAALRGLWGFGLALGTLALAAPLWQLNVLFPGMSVSLSAILGTALVALERWWILRNLGVRDPLTGFGNRLAFTRALEGRWQGRRTRPLGLLLIDLSGFRKVNEAYGRPAGDELLRDLAARIGPHKRRGDLIFRWGPDEFAVLLDNTSAPELNDLTARMQESLGAVTYRDLTLRANVGGAITGPDTAIPNDLIEAASRSRYRTKYQREQRGG